MVFYALVISVIGLLTLLELKGGASLDSNRLTNLLAWALKIGLGIVLLPLVALSVPVSLLHASALPWLVGFLIFFLVMDLGEYLFHRAQHAIPLMWAMHSLHHSDPDMNATTTERHFWGDQLLKAVTIWPAAALVISPTPSIAFAYMLASLWNYPCHSSIRFGFGRWSWVLNSPAYHRRHHSSLPQHYNSNYAALLPIWDVLLGSYNKPDGFPPTGLDTRPEHVGDLIAWPVSSTFRSRRLAVAATHDATAARSSQ